MAVPKADEAVLRIEDKLVRELEGERTCGRAAAGGGEKYDRSSHVHGCRGRGATGRALESDGGRYADREPNGLLYGGGAALRRSDCRGCCWCSRTLLIRAVVDETRKVVEGLEAELGVEGAVEVSKSARRQGSEQ